MEQSLSSSSSLPSPSDITSLKKRLLTNDNDDDNGGDNSNSLHLMQTPSSKRTCCTSSTCSSTIKNLEIHQLQQMDPTRVCITPSPISTSSSSSSSSSNNNDAAPDENTKRITGINLPPASTTNKNIKTTSSINNDDDIDTANVIVKTPKRSNYLTWDEYFLAVAILSSKRSKDPISPSGACIVDKQNRVVGIGYSGFPKGCSDDIFPWRTFDSSNNNNSNNVDNWLHTKLPYVSQAVPNAILNKSSNDVCGCRIYVTAFPTSDCTKMIIQSGIKEIVILGKKNNNKISSQEIVSSSSPSSSSTKTDSDVKGEEDDDDDDKQASRILLEMAGVKLRYYQPPRDNIVLDFLPSLTPVATATTTNNKATVDSKESGNEPEDASKDSLINFDHDKEAIRLLWEEAGYDHEKQKREDPNNNKRKNYLSWQDYFMSMAFLTAQRSKDPNTQVGAAIVSQNDRIIGLGYNGFPTGCSDDRLPWARSNTNKLHNKYVYVCHAEVNAILNKGSSNVEGAIIYVALFPCENCAKMIIQSGIKEVVFMSDSYHDTPGCRASRIMFGAAGVKLTQYIPSMQKLTVEF